jgi:nicotinamidase-related amidase
MAPTALFVIDIQKFMLGNTKSEIPHAQRIRGAATSILSKARSSMEESRNAREEPKLSIIVVQHEEGPESGDLVRGTEPWEVVFPPRKGDAAERLVSKTDSGEIESLIDDVGSLRSGDTFKSNPQLADQLKAEGVETIITFGIQSDYCVRATSMGALSAGFKVTVFKGAHSTYDDNGKTAEEIERAVEEELREEGAEIVPWEDWAP